jgi:hypothetical protein
MTTIELNVITFQALLNISNSHVSNSHVSNSHVGVLRGQASALSRRTAPERCMKQALFN